MPDNPTTFDLDVTDEGYIMDADPTIFNLGDGRFLQVNVTDEGVIMDAYFEDDEPCTVGMTADEWFTFVSQRKREPHQLLQWFGPGERG
jgi:hypothetical protein